MYCFILSKTNQGKRLDINSFMLHILYFVLYLICQLLAILKNEKQIIKSISKLKALMAFLH